MRKTKLLIFDFDGTLVDSAPGIHKAMNIVAKEYNLPEFPLELITKLIGYGLNHLLKSLDEKLDAKSKDILLNVPEVRTRFLEVYRDISTQQIHFFPGLIEHLKSTPHLLAIVSNKEERPLKHLVQQSQLAQFQWVHICGADTYDQKKPDPKPLQETMKLASVTAQETIMIGDGLPDALSSKNAKVPFIGVDFGYAKAEDLKKHGARQVISSYSQLSKAIATIDSEPG